MSNLNTEIWIKHDEKNDRFCYTWQIGINTPKLTIFYKNKKRLFRTILVDIFRDKIPVEQVHIDQKFND